MLGLGLLLAGCSLGGPIARQAIDYNGAVETAANSLLLRNILRARDEMPLHFTTIPQIRGSMSLGLNQPGLGLPVSGSTAGLAVGLSGLISPSFDVSALDTQDFTRGLLEPLEPQIFRYYLERGYPDELLLLLLFSSIEQPGTGRRIPNDPRCWLGQPDCPEPVGSGAIVEALRATVALGRFVFHDYLSLTPLGPPITAAQAADPAMLGQVAEQRLRLLPVAGGRYQAYRAEPRVTACRRVTTGGRSVLVSIGAARDGPAPAEDAPICVRAEVVAAPEGPNPRGTERVLVRSVQEIIRFLGVLVRVQERLPPGPDGVPRCLSFAVVPGPDRATARRACLFQLLRNPPAVPSLRPAVTTEHEDGAYIVPRFREPAPDARPDQPGDYSLMVLALVTDLINLKKSSSAIPSTRAVQLVR